MKVLLVTLNAKFIHSSLALAYLKAFLQSESCNIEIKEYTINEQTLDILADIYKANADVVCFSCYIWNIEPIIELCRDYKSINPYVPIILGGPEVSYDAKEVLTNYPIDYIIRGEGEESLRELLMAIKNKSSYSSIKGITYREGNQIIENDDRELIKNLDIIPFPYQDNLSNYKNKTIYYETSRGCPFNCAYCLSSTIKGVRFFSLERVKNDLRYIMDNQVREVKFVDRTFNCNEERALEIMDFILKNNKTTKFHFEIEGELISDKFVDFLKNIPLGWFDFEIGIQSTFSSALQAVNRKTNWDNLQEKIKLLTDLGNIHIHLDLIAGLPYESYNDFSNSFNNVYNFKPDMLQLGFLKLLKGSPIREEADKYNYVYQAKPPYQVFSNHVITYEEMIRMDHIENLVSRYYNTHIIDETLNYVIGEIFSNNAFRFFEDFSRYWEEQNLFYLGHKRDREYSIVKEFIDKNYPNHSLMVNETLKYDYFKNNKAYHLPDKISTDTDVDTINILNNILKDEEFVANNFPQLKGKTVREMKKYLHLEYFQFNPLENYLNYGYLLFTYDSSRKAKQVIDLTEMIKGICL